MKGSRDWTASNVTTYRDGWIVSRLCLLAAYHNHDPHFYTSTLRAVGMLHCC